MSQGSHEWTVLGRTELYRSPWITVREDRVLQPDGEAATWCIAEVKPGLSVLPIADDGTVYLVRIFRYTIGRDSIEAIAGGIEPGESPDAAARRELHEEGGIEAADLLDLGLTDQLTEVVVSPCRLFLARGLSFTRPDREETEQMRLVTVPLEQALTWAMDGTITHAASMALLFKAARILESEGLHED
jgi:ADP-ribose pyrophosphatase